MNYFKINLLGAFFVILLFTLFVPIQSAAYDTRFCRIGSFTNNGYLDHARGTQELLKRLEAYNTRGECSVAITIFYPYQFEFTSQGIKILRQAAEDGFGPTIRKCISTGDNPEPGCSWNYYRRQQNRNFEEEEKIEMDFTKLSLTNDDDARQCPFNLIARARITVMGVTIKVNRDENVICKVNRRGEFRELINNNQIATDWSYQDGVAMPDNEDFSFLFLPERVTILDDHFTREGSIDDDDNDGDGFTVEQGDCDDNNAALNPETIWGRDADRDGSPSRKRQDHITRCTQPAGYRIVDSLIRTDCDDTDPKKSGPLKEISGTLVNGTLTPCDGIDNDCDGQIDESDACHSICPAPNGRPVCSDPRCAQHPQCGATANDEICDDERDNDNDRDIDCQDSDCNEHPDCVPIPIDADGDGYTTEPGPSRDCNDDNAAINPNANEICGNNVDDNCDGTDDVACDRDVDGFTTDVDCNDGNPAIHPEAVEIPNDGVDQDCVNGDLTTPAPVDLRTLDNDEDGQCPGGSGVTCQEAGKKTGDCNDQDPTIYKGAKETPGNGTDEDCNGSDRPLFGKSQADDDGDGYCEDSLACEEELTPNDCNDDDKNVHPEAPEICGNNIDDNCDQLIDELGCEETPVPSSSNGGGGCSLTPLVPLPSGSLVYLLSLLGLMTAIRLRVMH